MSALASFTPTDLKQVASSPGKLVLLLGGSFAVEIFVAMALSVSLRAFGDHLRLPVLIVIISVAAVIGGISPAVGGIGVVEAGQPGEAGRDLERSASHTKRGVLRTASVRLAVLTDLASGLR